MGHLHISPPPSAENPAKKPPFLALHRIQERASMAIMKRYRDRRPPCLKPLVLESFCWRFLGGNFLAKRQESLVMMQLTIDYLWPSNARIAQNFLNTILYVKNAGVFFSGFHGIPYTYVLPSVPTAAYNSMNYGPNGAGGKFQNNKVQPIP
ncbi:hypothetical protein CK203_028097 [Vitis vinifera]|uniref:Uncharacterized protein n=1 Tax=Vitis vinifera TaxID=29760 RepID=A0A438ILZ2_VITVI|nr:hypothetical protein CK203_028097 [Vitis vinifera]